MTPDVAHQDTQFTVKQLTDSSIPANILSDARNVAILADLQDEVPYREIAAKHHCSLTKVCELAASMETHEGAALKYLAIRGLSFAEDWKTASVKAADKGDHRPAKEALLHLGVIDPVQDTGPGTRVNIMIGAPGAPVPYPAMVIEQPPK